jgi:hypothetical protein
MTALVAAASSEPATASSRRSSARIHAGWRAMTWSAEPGTFRSA